MKRRSLPVAAALAASAALLLTACGGGDDGPDNDKIAGADQGSAPPRESAKPSTAPAEDKPDGVDLSLPKDMNLVFDWEKPKNKNEAAAMDDAANYLRAIYRGVDKRTTKDASLAAYATGDGLHYAETQIKEWIKGGWTGTGTRRHYEAATRSAPNGTSVEVSFCADTGKFYGKEVKTGKVLKSDPSLKDFDHYKIIMIKYPTAEDLWQASKVFVETEAKQCQ
ncbi:Lipoprotein OS=Streptomyces tendae OX=1932 GN=F3L20_02695 PE=4 SV=1 [Streptomyces tendae]